MKIKEELKEKLVTYIEYTLGVSCNSNEKTALKRAFEITIGNERQSITEVSEQPDVMSNDPLFANGLNDAAQQIHKAAKEKGFWDKPRETGTLLMLCVSELSEALEADRKGKRARIDDYIKGYSHQDNLQQKTAGFELHIKDSFEDELADTIIRILDLCGAKGIDIERHINLKLAYNKTREKMHGKAY